MVQNVENYWSLMCVLGRETVIGRSSQDRAPLLRWGVLHEGEDPIMKKSPHSCWGGAESLCILVGQEDPIPDVHSFWVMCEGVSEKAALESPGVAGFHCRRDQRNICSVHEPSFRAERP